MKELSIKEKAKAYDKAFERAKKLQETCDSQAVVGWCEYLFPELKESEGERIRKEIIEHIIWSEDNQNCAKEEMIRWIAWLEKQGEQKPAQEIVSFEAEHGKYYYCIKDYFCGGKKQASKGDVVQALRGLPIMGLKDASEYFLPVNLIKCNPAWSEEDSLQLDAAINIVTNSGHTCTSDWLESLKDRVQPRPKQEWSEEDEKCIRLSTDIIDSALRAGFCVQLDRDRCVDWLKSLRPKNTWKPSEEQMKALHDLNLTGNISYAGQGQVLIRLYNDLKKLKGE